MQHDSCDAGMYGAHWHWHCAAVCVRVLGWIKSACCATTHMYTSCVWRGRESNMDYIIIMTTYADRSRISRKPTVNAIEKNTYTVAQVLFAALPAIWFARIYNIASDRYVFREAYFVAIVASGAVFFSCCSYPAGMQSKWKTTKTNKILRATKKQPFFIVWFIKFN